MTSVHDAEESVAAADGRASDSVVERSWAQDAFRPMVSFTARRRQDWDLPRSTAHIARHPPLVGCNTHTCGHEKTHGARGATLRLRLTSVSDGTALGVVTRLRPLRTSGLPQARAIHPTSPLPIDGAALPRPASAHPERGRVLSWLQCQLGEVSTLHGLTRRTVASRDFRKDHQEGVMQCRTDFY